MSRVLRDLVQQAPAGAVVGVSAVIYAFSYGALLFSGPLAASSGLAISAALITAAVGAVYGLMSQERTFINGPDSNTISLLAVILGSVGSSGLSMTQATQSAAGLLIVTSLVCALMFVALARFKWSGLIRYIPFPVMAGFLASTGWLMCSGGLSIIADMPLSKAGWTVFTHNPYRPELALGLCCVLGLFLLARRVATALLIPGMVLAATLIVNLAFNMGWCEGCQAGDWLFAGLETVEWQSTWVVGWSSVESMHWLAYLPSMLVVGFVGVMTILLSLASLEYTYHREFDLDQALTAHARSTVLATALGGFVGILSIGRTTLNKSSGGGVYSGLVAAAICLSMFWGAGQIIAFIPKAALGAIVLYLGLNMLKQWLWDVRRQVTRLELFQIATIVCLVTQFGYLVGFVAGLVLACVMFVLTYSRLPIARWSTHLGLLSSSVVRSEHQVEILETLGHSAVVYRLEGYVFFGSASKIDAVFHELDFNTIRLIVLDFSKVRGIDRAAIGVFQRILLRLEEMPLNFKMVYDESNRALIESMASRAKRSTQVAFFPSLDLALECTEEELLAQRPLSQTGLADCLGFIEDDARRDVFLSYCDHQWLKTDDVLCLEGEYSDAIYFVAQGRFEIVKHLNAVAPLRLAKISAGSVVGEMAFYTGEARSASIRAVEPSEVYVLRRPAWETMREHNVDLARALDVMVVRKLSHSLKRTNELLAAQSN